MIVADEVIERLSYIDRTGWEVGAWDDEPDKVVWRDDTSGLPCIIRRNRLGAWCGYVGIPEGHPWFELGSYWDVPLCDVNVHGGLTFGPAARDEDPEGICHVRRPDEPEVHWIGFDLHHGFDFAPGHAAIERKMGWAPLLDSSAYRDMATATAECEALARQIDTAR